MTKGELTSRTEHTWTQTHDALQLVIEALNQGQRQKLLKNEEVKNLLDRYGVDYK